MSQYYNAQRTKGIYTGHDSWVEKTILDIHQCLNGEAIPKAKPDCDYCAYVQAVKEK